MHFSNIFKHSDKTAPATAQDEAHKEHGKHHHEKREHQDLSQLPKGFANDAMRTSNTPDTLYGFDDPTARRLGPVPSSDPTNTGA
ncbi:hypothetical protein FB192DRAFT_1363060 [Mucor lusitanicus]|uniref:Uncharacterized protein n=1 Tax=Mucor circinelloides f. lusitanicus TaxID=29924 RepID=A0A8H4BNK0_MUCCL|nr:hypothetical protein FB192DRAFT_1363060 [Mucor lusitanicus]